MWPDLEDLRCVDALARAGRFHAAARHVGLSPSAFGRRVRRAEEVLGAPLFARTTRSVRLTEAGARQLPRIRSLLAAAHALTAPLEGSRAPVELTIGTRHELGLSWLMPARRQLTESLPFLTVHLRFGAADRLLEEVAQQRVDAAVLSQRPGRQVVLGQPLHPEHYVTVASPERVAAEPLVDAEDARQHVLVDIDETQPLWSYVARRHGELPWRRTLSLGTIAAVREAVRQGEGVATLPAYFVERDREEGRLVQVLPERIPDPDTFRLLHRRDHPHAPVLGEVAEVLRQWPLQ